MIDPQIIAGAEKGRGTPEGVQAAAATLRAGGTTSELWGAVYVYSTDGDDPALLAPLLKHESASLRVLAAGGLLRMGDKAGFSALVEETANTRMLAGSEPPQSVGEVAAIMLAMASGEDIDPTPGAASQQAWRTWYAAHAERLGFDAGKGWRTR